MYGKINIQITNMAVLSARRAERTKMHISNAQIKSLLDTYTMIILAKSGSIPINDICNHDIIKRYEKVLNDLLQDRINENNANNELFLKARKVIKHNGKLQ